MFYLQTDLQGNWYIKNIPYAVGDDSFGDIYLPHVRFLQISAVVSNTDLEIMSFNQGANINLRTCIVKFH